MTGLRTYNKRRKRKLLKQKGTRALRPLADLKRPKNLPLPSGPKRPQKPKIKEALKVKQGASVAGSSGASDPKTAG
ncbi:hypothetical protein DDF67_10970 [Caulobacter endophyticus]|uniref:Uncharacterized protein n=2 Tax=Caulobacter endophyticus TaxID=2172652 RepID=A0A2T9K2B0_9CAUL|nr:hypothetical protein DDF67_10970 [Caulobacter endophyticus]